MNILFIHQNFPGQFQVSGPGTGAARPPGGGHDDAEDRGAGVAAGIVTHNVRDLGRGELAFDQLRVLTSAQCLEEWQ